jgi:EAL domain-containing protein (putative c-di-GMP-specific phosphodiesterase class I)
MDSRLVVDHLGIRIASRPIAAFAASLGLETVAEGIETIAERDVATESPPLTTHRRTA